MQNILFWCMKKYLYSRQEQFILRNKNDTWCGTVSETIQDILWIANYALYVNFVSLNKKYLLSPHFLYANVLTSDFITWFFWNGSFKERKYLSQVNRILLIDAQGGNTVIMTATRWHWFTIVEQFLQMRWILAKKKEEVRVASLQDQTNAYF